MAGETRVACQGDRALPMRRASAGPSGSVNLPAGRRSAEDYLPRIARRLANGETIRIVAFGSSSTEGVGASSPTAAYPVVLQRDLAERLHRPNGVVVLNSGAGGQNASDMLKRLDRDALGLRPDLVVWQTGTNDALQGVPLDRFKDETRAALLALKGAGVDVILMEPQWCPVLDRTPGSLAYRDTVRDLGAELIIPVIRRSDRMREWLSNRLLTFQELFAPDELHMTDGGYALLAGDVAAEILRNSRYELSGVD